MNGPKLSHLLATVLTIWLMSFVSAHAQNCANVKSGINANQKPQNTARKIVGKSLDQIQDQGHMLFAVYEDFPPYSYEKNGKLVGVDIDLAKLIASDLGVEARFYKTAADENVDADLRNNIWKGRLIGGQIANVMLHVPYNRELACRNEQVVFTGQYFNERIAIAFTKKDYPDGGPIPAYFRYDEVGVENDTISDFYLAGIGNGVLVPKMKRYKNYYAAMKGLSAGEVKAVMGPIGELEHGLTDQLDVHTPSLPGLAVGQWTLGVAVRYSWRPLAYAVDDSIRAAVSDGRMKNIFEKHGLSYTEPNW